MINIQFPVFLCHDVSQAEGNIVLAVIAFAFLIVFSCCFYRLLVTINYNSPNGYYFLFNVDAHII